MRTAWIWVALAIVVGLSGCGRRRSILDNPRYVQRFERQLIGLAAVESGCPPTSVVPVRVDRQLWVTNTCNAPREYTIECGRRNCQWRPVPTLADAAAPLLSCQPQMVQQQVLNPTQRNAVGCGRAAPFVLSCQSPSLCGWSAAGPVVAQQVGVAGVSAGAPPTSGGVTVQVPSAPPAAAPSSNLQQQIQNQREAVLSCIEGTTLTLRLRWGPDGQVIIMLPEQMIGTVAEQCIQAVLGGLTVQTDVAGEIVVPLQ